jgi:hypothetical protein
MGSILMVALYLFLVFSQLSEYYCLTVCESRRFTTTFNFKFNYAINIQSLRESIHAIEYLVANDIHNSDQYINRKKSRTISPIKAYIKMNFSNHKRNREFFTYKEILHKCVKNDENIGVQLMDIFLNPESDVHIIHPNIYDLLSITSLYGNAFPHFYLSEAISDILCIPDDAVESGNYIHQLLLYILWYDKYAEIFTDRFEIFSSVHPCLI